MLVRARFVRPGLTRVGPAALLEGVQEELFVFPLEPRQLSFRVAAGVGLDVRDGLF